MTLPAAELLGSQRPRLLHTPPGIVTTSGPEIAELAELAGLWLDPWQRWSLNCGLAERADGQWAAIEVAEVVSRQNGKGSVIEALELGGLYVLGLPLVLHTAHEFKTAQEGFRRVLHLIDNCDDLRRKVAKVRTAHGDEGVELLPKHGGGRLRFIARSGGSGRGFSAPLVILDEAYALQAAQVAALMPTLSAQPNPQLWSFSSAAMATSTYLHRLRKRALAGDAGRLAYMEWSIDPATDDPADPNSWGRANPALGLRIDPEFVKIEHASMPIEVFLRERLGVPDAEVGEVVPVFTDDEWAAVEDRASEIVGPTVLALDMPPDRSKVSIAVGGRRADGVTHVEIIERRAGTRWLVTELARLLSVHDIRHVLLTPGGPAGAVLPDVEEACRQGGRWPASDMLRAVGSQDYGAACGRFFDAVIERSVRHIGQVELDQARRAASRKWSGDAWRWARQSTDVDISPLVAGSLAVWAVDALPVAEKPEPFMAWG